MGIIHHRARINRSDVDLLEHISAELLDSLFVVAKGKDSCLADAFFSALSIGLGAHADRGHQVEKEPL